MKPTQNWENTQGNSASIANAAELTAGGHGETILKIDMTEINGKEVMLIYHDIKDGSEFDGYFMNKFNNQKKFGEATFKGIYRMFTTGNDGNTNSYFKGFITAVENSNPGYKWNWDEKTLKGKKVGIVYRMEDWEYNGYSGTTARPFYFCDFDAAPEMPEPKPKKLKAQPVAAKESIVETADDDLPF